MPVFHPTIGREGETATFLYGLSVFPTLRVGGFAPRQLNRYASVARRSLLKLNVFKTLCGLVFA